jgi:hypothetical protein
MLTRAIFAYLGLRTAVPEADQLIEDVYLEMRGGEGSVARAAQGAPMTDEHEHDGEFKSRTVGFIDAGEDTHIEVEHAYDNTSAVHGGLVNKGLVGIAIHDQTPGEEQFATALLGARDALLLADRITRAAHLALELEEDLPDVEREYLRHSERQDDSLTSHHTERHTDDRRHRHRSGARRRARRRRDQH